jgi:hypothetical protein
MSWGAQSRPKDAKTPSASGGRSEKPELEAISGAQVQQYAMPVCFLHWRRYPASRAELHYTHENDARQRMLLQHRCPNTYIHALQHGGVLFC